MKEGRVLESNIALSGVKRIRFGLLIFNVSFVLFWLSLLLMGVKKAYWSYFTQTLSFGKFQDSMHWYYLMFVLFGVGILIGLYLIIFELLKSIRKQLI